MCNVTLKDSPSLKTGITVLNYWHCPVVQGLYLHDHHAAEHRSKTGWTKPRKHLPRSNLSWNTRQDFFKIPSLWTAATEQRCFSKVILESNVTPNIWRSSDSFSTVPPTVNAGDWGCIVRYLVLVFLVFNLIPQRTHCSVLTNFAEVTVQGLCYCNSDAWGWPNRSQSGVIDITGQLILQNGKKLKGVQEEQQRP